MVLGIVQAITGIILQQFYHPHPVQPGAYDSILDIIKQPDLSFVRNLHYWGAQLIVFIIFLHMIRVYISGSYKKPREVQWLAGVGLLLLLFGLTFSGTVLKWDQEAVEALGHQVEVGETIGFIGKLFTSQFSPDVPLLTRLYAAHVTLLPGLVIPILGLHLALVRILGISNPTQMRGDKVVSMSDKKVTYSTHVKRMLSYGIGITIIAILLSLLIPASLSMRGIEVIEVTKPPWYLLWIFPLEDSIGLDVIPYVSLAIVGILIAVPFLDRKPETDPRKRKKMIIGMLVLVAIFISLMIGGAVAPMEQHL